MFDRVLAPELIPSVLEKSIRVYMREHDLQEEELLLLYIEVAFSLESVLHMRPT
jgi:kinetochore-associated protein 1